MQTKNINIDRTSNLEENEIFTDIPEKTLLMLQKQCGALQMGRFEDGYAPPLPPRSSFILGVLPQIPKPQVEVDAGYGPYKPVPPPKPLPQQPCGSNQHQQDCLTPPPYRMPPYPLYNEPSIPGAASGVLEHPIASSSPAGTQGLHTHSSKFPIEREVILSSTDKNSKIPILHDYKKKSKGSVAPDAPPKQMSAWSEGQGHQILPDQTHSGLIQTIQQTGDPNNPTYRSQYHHQEEYYNAQCTGAVPRSSWHGDKSGRPYQEEYTNGNAVETKEMPAKEQKKSMTKTYHTIKDIISSRFKSNKDNCDDKEEPGLNNVADDVRKNQGNIAEEEIKKVTEQSHYGKPSTTPSSTTTSNSSQQQQQHTYNQHMIQQHIMAQQQYQVTQQLKSQQYSQQLMQARSQEMLAPRQYDQMYYQGYGSPPPRNQRVPQQQIREQTFVHMEQHVQFVNGNKELPNKDRPQQLLQSERRSAQQLERDNMRQRSFEARRAASQPQLAYDDIPKTEQDNRPQPQMASNQMRRGSHGNIMDTIVQKSEDNDKDSDDGGFLQRLNSKEAPRLPQETKMTENLQGTPRKKLEGEIGKIEGVYNVGQRSSRTEEDIRQLKKANPSSANSSDYDKTGGQSSSNVDSGRGSAAYSSGRRPPTSEINGESLDSNQLNRTVQSQGHDSEWVDIVENELRHILEPKLHELSLQTNPGIANSTLSESISSMTPPLPPLSPGDQSSPNVTPRNSTRYKHSTSLPYGSKPNYEDYKHKGHPRDIAGSSRYGNSSQKHRSGKKVDHNALLRGKQIFGLDTTDLTSTTTRSLDLESMLDGQSDSEGDISTTDARTIRKQLEGLESMYSEVLKLLGVNKKMHGKYQPSDPRFSKRRYGSMSSLPSSSVSSRPIRDKRRASEDRKKVRDIRGINKRFQRLESHVVTLARSVAHLSSEMRTQHLMIQEMENIRGEIAALRAQTNMLNVRSQSAARAVSNKELPTLANPSRVKKLTKFFGDEPPLLRLFLRKLGYEKYANVFENERVGMVELPYLSEERLQKMGLPLGPRLRIMQEAQISVCKDNTLCIV